MGHDRHDNMAMPGQGKIWHYYQTEAPETFRAARPRLDYLLRQIARHAIMDGPRVLNIGVGDGYFEKMALARGWTVHSLDPDRASLVQLAQVGVHVQVGMIDAIPLADSAFDFVVASEVFEHLTDDQRRRGVVEIARLLVPGGRFLGTVPYHEDLDEGRVVCPHCGQTFHRWGHLHSFDLARIATELSEHFKVQQVRRTAFVTYRDRSMLGKIKSLARWGLARYGQPIAVPSIYWMAERKRG
ncbi:MAG: class I SAM-dependent methyltransferase [Pirellulales bacterium]